MFASGVLLWCFYALEVNALTDIPFLPAMFCVVLGALFGLFINFYLYFFCYASKLFSRHVFLVACIFVTLFWSNISSFKRQFNINLTKDVTYVPDYFFATWQMNVKKSCIHRYESSKKQDRTWMSDLVFSCIEEKKEHPGSRLSDWCINTFEKSPFPAAEEEPLPSSLAAWCIATFSAPEANSTATNNTSGDGDSTTSSNTALEKVLDANDA